MWECGEEGGFLYIGFYRSYMPTLYCMVLSLYWLEDIFGDCSAIHLYVLIVSTLFYPSFLGFLFFSRFSLLFLVY
jgi:hypothetical protein